MLQLSAGIWIELAVWLALARVAQPALELLPIQRPLFYESVRESGAQILERMGAELLAIRYALAERWPEVALSAVLPVHWAIWAAYGDDIGDPSTLYSTIRTNRAYAGIRTPMREVDGGVVPDYGGRFFTEDIPFGLVVANDTTKQRKSWPVARTRSSRMCGQPGGSASGDSQLAAQRRNER